MMVVLKLCYFYNIQIISPSSKQNKTKNFQWLLIGIKSKQCRQSESSTFCFQFIFPNIITSANDSLHSATMYSHFYTFLLPCNVLLMLCLEVPTLTSALKGTHNLRSSTLLSLLSALSLCTQSKVNSLLFVTYMSVSTTITITTSHYKKNLKKRIDWYLHHVMCGIFEKWSVFFSLHSLGYSILGFTT